MIQQVFLVLPVADVPRSLAFFQALGFTHNPQMTDDNTACIVVSESILVMTTTHEKFREFALKDACDTRTCLEALFTLGCESRQEVDNLVAKALAAGGSTIEEAQDYGFMYTHGFVDPDGHQWGLVHSSATPSKD